MSIFPSGSFSRFQARVLEAFPNPTRDPAVSNAEVCDVYLNRNFVKLSWRGRDGQLCYFHSLMLHNNRTMEFAWIAWLWTTSNQAAENHFLEGRQGGGVNAVMDQMVGWMEDACTVNRRTPPLKEERLRRSAFFVNKAALFADGHDNFLKANESEEATDDVASSGRDGEDIKNVVRSEVAGLRADMKHEFQKVHRRFDEFRDVMDHSFDRVIRYSLDRPKLLEILDSYRCAVQNGGGTANDGEQHVQYQKLGLVPVATVMEFLEQQSSKQLSHRILEAIEDVKNAVQEKGSILETMVESVVHADNEIPCTALLLPQALARRLRDNFAGKPVSRWRRFKREFSTKTSPLSKPLYLYFFCPVTGHIMPSNGGRGFELFVPRE
eukprot:scaffold4969_cov293-Pinguiococcus_pyrenoidosus.AAC.1